MNPAQFLSNFIQEKLPYVQEYGNALFGFFTPQGLNSQPFGGSGLYGYEPDGSPRSMGGALDFIGSQSQKRNDAIEALRRRY